ncbi:MAG: RNA polymerase subunit sigma-70, partial [Lysinibacillus sp.]
MSFLMTLIQMYSDFPALFGYIKGQTFSKPLTPEEEQEVLKRLLEGDEEARLTLIERNMRLVAHVVKKFHPTHEQLDDY